MSYAKRAIYLIILTSLILSLAAVGLVILDNKADANARQNILLRLEVHELNLKLASKQLKDLEPLEVPSNWLSIGEGNTGLGPALVITPRDRSRLVPDEYEYTIERLDPLVPTAPSYSGPFKKYDENRGWAPFLGGHRVNTGDEIQAMARAKKEGNAEGVIEKGGPFPFVRGHKAETGVRYQALPDLKKEKNAAGTLKAETQPNPDKYVDPSEGEFQRKLRGTWGPQTAADLAREQALIIRRLEADIARLAEENKDIREDVGALQKETVWSLKEIMTLIIAGLGPLIALLALTLAHKQAAPEHKLLGQNRNKFAGETRVEFMSESATSQALERV